MLLWATFLNNPYSDPTMHPALYYLFNLEHFGMKLGLETITKLLAALDNPQERIESVHVAGTNGKGSTCAFLYSILREAGYKVGLYTSPHLVCFTERMVVNGKEISEGEMIPLIEKIRAVAEREKLEVSYFEFVTAMAWLYFSHKKVDIAIIEVGMGGRLDATNVINPLVTVITHIDIDHTTCLGKTVSLIAKEKAGILKQGVPLVTAEKRKKVLTYFQEECTAKNSALFQVENLLQSTLVKNDLGGQEFETSGLLNSRWKTRMLGEYQLENACTALVTAKLLQERGYTIPRQALQAGVAKACWPGRLQVMQQNPLVIIDGSHNLKGMKELKKFLENIPQRKVLVLGIAKDKQIAKMVSLIVPLFERVILTQGNFKPAPLQRLTKAVQKYTSQVEESKNVAEALEKAKGYVKKGEMVLVTGSLYVAGDALAAWK